MMGCLKQKELQFIEKTGVLAIMLVLGVKEKLFVNLSPLNFPYFPGTFYYLSELDWDFDYPKHQKS